MDDQARPEVGWGQRVKRLRRERGWSQRDLAREAAVGQAQLSRIESGSQDDANISTAVRLAEALDTSLDALIGRQAISVDPRVRELARLVLGLDGADEGSQAGQAGQAGQRRGGLRRRATVNTDENYEAVPARVEAYLAGALAPAERPALFIGA